MDEPKSYVNIEVPPGLKNRLDKYLEKSDRQYNTIAQFVISAIQRELEKQGA